MTRADLDKRLAEMRARGDITAGGFPPCEAAVELRGDRATAIAWARGTTRAPRRPAPRRRQGSRRATAKAAGGGGRGDPEGEPPGRRRGDLVHVGELLPSLLDRLEQGLLNDDDAADLSWWLAGRRP